MSDLTEQIISEQPPEVQAAIRELQDRGLMFCAHFGYQNSVQTLADMNLAFEEGRLYEWMAKTVGMPT